MTASESEATEQAPETGQSGFEQAISGMAPGQIAGDDKIEGFAGSLQDGVFGKGAPPGAANELANNSAMIMGLPVMMKVVLGTAKMPVAAVAKLAKGAVVKLDKMVGDPVDILVNGRLIARGEVVVLNDGSSRFGVVLTQVGGLTPSTK